MNDNNNPHRHKVDDECMQRIRYRILMIANEFNIDNVQIYSSQKAEHVRIRHCITHILTNVLNISRWCVADITYKKSHQTVLRGAEKFEYDMETNKLYQKIFNKCMQYLGDINE